MKSIRHIVMLALPRHDEKFNSTSWQLATSFVSQGVDVFYIDHPYTWTDFFKNFYKGAFIKAFINTFFPQWKLVNGVRVLSPVLFIPINFLSNGKTYRALNHFNQLGLSKVINRQLRKQKVCAYSLINSFDFYLNEIHHLLKAPSQFIYHCIDPMIKPYTRKHGLRQELQIASDADKVIVTAPALAQKFRKLGKDTYLVPNAADVEKCMKALEKETTPDAIIEKIRRPILGYLGNIERRIDFELLLETAERLSEWNIVLVGPREEQYIPETFKNHPRIHLIPQVKSEEIPSVLKTFDVGMIPFKKDEASSGIYPLKLYEYLAAGLPVTSTSFNIEILKDFEEGVLYLANSPEEFANQANKAFLANSEEQVTERVTIAKKNSWVHRTTDFLGILEKDKKCQVH